MKNQRILTLLILIFVAINSFAQEILTSSNPIQPGEVLINGHIKNYKGLDKTGNLFIRDAITGLTNQELFSIDSAGNFKTSFDLVCLTMNSSIQIGKTWFYLYLVPGETYNLTINENGTHVFTGENSELNNDINELNTAILSKFKKDNSKLSLYHRNNSIDYQSFERLWDDLLKRKLDFVDEYCKKSKISQKAIDIVKLDLSYEPAWALIVFRCVWSDRARINREGLPANYYQHIYDKFPINNLKALGSGNYNAYITNIKDIMWEDYFYNDGIFEYLKKTNRFSEQELFYIKKNFMRDTSITKTKEFTQFIDAHRDEISQHTKKYLTKFLLDSIKYFPSGLGRDLIISQAISFFYLKDQTSSPSNNEWNRIDSLIANKNILSYLKKIDQFNQAKAFRPTNGRANILSPLLKNESDKIFEKLIGKYKGKVVYIDFWATWCGPCRQELPHSKILSSHFDGQDVVFLYLCCQSDKKNWENTIKSEQMTGDQYLLSTDEYNILSKTFNIHGVPTYVLIDRKGNIVEKNAPRPSSGPITITQIDKLLKQ